MSDLVDDETERKGDTTRITRGSAGWPEGFASLVVEPQELWAKGRVELLRPGPRIAIVGSRAPTHYGETQARRFGYELAARGITVVSGLARGVDAAAHEGALAAGGPTIAVLGSGVDRPWPEGPLAACMGVQGLLLSEFAPGTRPRRHHFPLRNRLIAALADAVLVVEAAESSGSLITARWAADQGQDVFALPGRVDHPMALGTLRVIREGATPVGAPAMLVEDVYGPGAAPAGTCAAPHPDEERTLVVALRGETLGAAELADRLGRGVGEVLAELTTLELDGRVVRRPGGLYGLP